MSRSRGLPAVGMAIACMISAEAACGASRIVDVDWNDTQLQASLDRIGGLRNNRLESSSALPTSDLPVSLPVLGLPIPDRSAAKSLESLGNQPGALYSYDRKKGYWYTQVSKGRGLTILIKGSRYLEDDAVALAAGEIDVQFIVEDGRENPTEAVATFMRFGAPYSVTLTCVAEGDPRCSSDTAVKTIVNSLHVLGGKR